MVKNQVESDVIKRLLISLCENNEKELVPPKVPTSFDFKRYLIIPTMEGRIVLKFIQNTFPYFFVPLIEGF